MQACAAVLNVGDESTVHVPESKPPPPPILPFHRSFDFENKHFREHPPMSCNEWKHERKWCIYHPGSPNLVLNWLVVMHKALLVKSPPLSNVVIGWSRGQQKAQSKGQRSRFWPNLHQTAFSPFFFLLLSFSLTTIKENKSSHTRCDHKRKAPNKYSQ